MLTVKEAAARLKLSSSTVYALIDAGKLGAYRTGVERGGIRISEEDLDAYLALCRVEPKEPKRRASLPQLKHIKL